MSDNEKKYGVKDVTACGEFQDSAQGLSACSLEGKPTDTDPTLIVELPVADAAPEASSIDPAIKRSLADAKIPENHI